MHACLLLLEHLEELLEALGTLRGTPACNQMSS